MPVKKRSKKEELEKEELEKRKVVVLDKQEQLFNYNLRHRLLKDKII